MRKGTLKRALGYLGASRLAILMSGIIALLTVALTLYTPILIGEAIDLLAYGAGTVDFDKLLSLILTAVLLVGITAILQWIMAAVNNRICHRAIADMRKDAFGKLGYMPQSFIDKSSHGDTVNRIINDTERFGEGLLLGASQVFVGVLTIIGTLAFMVAINYKIALVVFLLTPISVFIAKFIGKRTFNMFRERSECEGKSSAYVNEMLANEKLVLA
ncbi:MAG: ABC transporter ATP-binding protein, partial [Clostridia bacterium]|nr:ABC transporter ATP-binding protein [Clostridia bacterium]